MFFLLLILIILGFLLWPAIRTGYTIWRSTKQMRDFMRDPQAAYRRAAGQAYGHSSQSAQRPQPKARRKKIDPEVGEYVAFTEIDSRTSTSASSTGSTTSYRTEQQVTDIEWEDIK